MRFDIRSRVRRRQRTPSLLPSLCSLTLLGLLSGCYDLGTLDGHALGEPVSTIYGFDASGNRLMVVFSDLPYLCSRLRSTTPPSNTDFWVLSISDEGFAAITRDGATTEYQASRRTIEWDYDCDTFPLFVHQANCPVDGSISLVFDTGDVVEAQFQAEYCDAPLFNGK